MDNSTQQEKVQAAFEEFKKRAEKLLADDGAVEKILRECEEWLKCIPKVGDDLKNVPVFISLIRAYITKEYTEPSRRAIIALLAGVLYCVTPIDLIPDFLGPIGMIDDAAVVAFCYTYAKPDIEAYALWRDNH